jgi:hypothetical protein
VVVAAQSTHKNYIVKPWNVIVLACVPETTEKIENKVTFLLQSQRIFCFSYIVFLLAFSTLLVVMVCCRVSAECKFWQQGDPARRVWFLVPPLERCHRDQGERW